MGSLGNWKCYLKRPTQRLSRRPFCDRWPFESALETLRRGRSPDASPDLPLTLFLLLQIEKRVHGRQQYLQPLQRGNLLTSSNVFGVTPSGKDRRQSTVRRRPGFTPFPCKGTLSPTPLPLPLSPLRWAQGQGWPTPSPPGWSARRLRPRLDRRRARRTGRPRRW